MAETKRVSDRYTISAPTVVISGNLTVTGGSTIVSSSDAHIADNLITLNDGEVGAGVTTLGTTAGIMVDRGSLPDVGIRWNEATTKWQFTSDGSTWADILTAASGVPGSDKQITYNSSGVLAAEAGFEYDYTTNVFSVGNLSIAATGVVSTTNTNGNMLLSPNGTGVVVVSTATALDYQGSPPASIASKSVVYGATPGAGGSGVFYINTSTNDELVSKRKAVALALIM